MNCIYINHILLRRTLFDFRSVFIQQRCSFVQSVHDLFKMFARKPGENIYLLFAEIYICILLSLLKVVFILAVKEVFLLSISKISERKLISGTDILCNLKNTIGHCSILYFVPEH